MPKTTTRSQKKSTKSIRTTTKRTTKKGSAKLVRSYNDRYDLSILSKPPVLILIGLFVIFFCFVGFLVVRDQGSSSAAGPLTPQPTQPAGFFYNSEPSSAWARPGAMVVCGRANCGGQGFKNVSAAGGTVLVYIDTIIDSKVGRYHDKLLNQSECGQAIGLWPGGQRFNGWGYVNDVRVNGALQKKLPCVLEMIVRENPHIGGFFADDLGGDNGHTQAKLPKEEYYQAAVALSKTFRSVADKYNLMFIPNGGWEGSHGAGYPNRNVSGNALADGSCVEHHSAGELGYWTPYLRSSQWATQSPLTRGTAFHIVITYPGGDFNAYKGISPNGFIANQTAYNTAGSPWGAFHSTGLPTKVNGSTGTPIPTPNPTPTPAPTPTPTPNPPTPPPTTKQAPYKGTARAIPGTIQTEDFDEGGEGVSYHDTTDTNYGQGLYRSTAVDIEASSDETYNIGWVADSEWLEYTTNVTAGNYDINVRAATLLGGGSITLKQDGANLGTLAIPATGGWQSWQTFTMKNIPLAGGSGKVIRMEMSGQAVNTNWLNFTRTGGGSTVPTGTITNAETSTKCASWQPIPGGCQSLLVNDALAFDGKAVILISKKDSISQTMQVPTNGRYRIGASLRSESYRGDAKVNIYIDNKLAYKEISVKPDKYNLYYSDRTLSAGSHTMRIEFVNDQCGNRFFMESCKKNNDRNLLVDYWQLLPL